MGAFVSVPECESHYNIVVDCTVKGAKNADDEVIPPYTSLGGVKKGEFEGDSDIAGVGVLGVFIAVTSFALVLSLIDVIWQWWKIKQRRSTKQIERKPVNATKYGFSEMLETVVLACSDQQLVTGGAYGITLRYWKGCSVSAYHYNIVANMMLLTCATHLMSVTIVRNYWRYSLLALLRIICTTGVFIVAGLLLTNQNADDKLRFPTEIPPMDETESLMFLPAACFESEYNTAPETFRNSTSSARVFFNTLKTSEPGNELPGWNWFLIMVLFYGAAVLVEIGRFFRRAKSRPGWRAKVYKMISSTGKRLRLAWFAKIAQGAFLVYLFGGVTIGFAIIFVSSRYIMGLRRWVGNSGWIQVENGMNPEDDWSSFGQLVPIWSTLIILFGFLTAFSEFFTARHNSQHKGKKRPDQEGTLAFVDPDNYNTYHSVAGGDTPALDGEAAKKRRQSSNNTLSTTTTEYFGVSGLALNSPGTTPFLADMEKQAGWSFVTTSAVPDSGNDGNNNHNRTSSSTQSMTFNGGIPEDPQSAAPLLGSMSPPETITTSPVVGGGGGGGGGGGAKRFSAGSGGGRVVSMQQQQQQILSTPRPAATTEGGGGGGGETRYSAVPQDMEEEQGNGHVRKASSGSSTSAKSGGGRGEGQ